MHVWYIAEIARNRRNRRNLGRCGVPFLHAFAVRREAVKIVPPSTDPIPAITAIIVPLLPRLFPALT
jgi:hypothetical protein